MADMEMLQKLMAAKKGASGEMDPDYKKSKMDVLKALHDEMGKQMGGDMKGLKQVTVAAPDKSGLAEGLDKAKEMMGSGDSSLGAMGEDSEGEAAMDSDEMPAEEPKTPEEVDAKIKELEALKAQMLMQKA